MVIHKKISNFPKNEDYTSNLNDLIIFNGFMKSSPLLICHCNYIFFLKTHNGVESQGYLVLMKMTIIGHNTIQVENHNIYSSSSSTAALQIFLTKLTFDLINNICLNNIFVRITHDHLIKQLIGAAIQADTIAI